MEISGQADPTQSLSSGVYVKKLFSLPLMPLSGKF
jgi:hypothetical protein